jgi:hypothetical protein
VWKVGEEAIAIVDESRIADCSTRSINKGQGYIVRAIFINPRDREAYLNVHGQRSCGCWHLFKHDRFRKPVVVENFAHDETTKDIPVIV